MKFARLEDVSEFVLDGTHSSPVRVEVGVPVLSAQNVKHGVLSFETDRFTTDEAYRAFNSRMPLKKGDVLLTIVGTIGRAAVVTELRPLVFQRSVAIIRPKEEALHPRFFLHATQGHNFQAQLARSTNASSQAGVYLGKLKELRIPLPPMEEQRRIAEVLDRAESLRYERRAALAQLDSLIQSIFLDLFGDPIVRKTRWPVSTLGETCAKITDGTHHSPPTQQVGVPYITAKHLKEHGLAFEADPWFVTEEAHREIYSRCDPKPGDVLYIKDGATTGLAAINRYTFPFSMLSSLALLRTDKCQLESEYLCHWLNNTLVKREMLGGMAGAAIRRLTLAKIKAVKLPVPPIELQHEFARQVEAVEKLKAAQRSSHAELDALFASLQHRAFSGEL